MSEAFVANSRDQDAIGSCRQTQKIDRNLETPCHLLACTRLMTLLAVMPDGPDTLKTRSTLLSKVRRGDEGGWSRFYELYQEFISSAARGAGLSPEEAEDVVQETMIKVRDYISHFVPDQGRARFRTWLRTIVHSRIAD